MFPLSGSNTDSFTTYLYLTGPCQPVCGANLTDPDMPLFNRCWIYIYLDKCHELLTVHGYIILLQKGWETGDLKIQPGVYTIYATSKPVDACHLTDLCCIYHQSNYSAGTNNQCNNYS